MLNISYRRVGGLRFLKVGRLTVQWCVSSSYRPIKGTAAHARSIAPLVRQLEAKGY